MGPRAQDGRAPICPFYSCVQAVGELTLASDVGHPPLQHQQACMGSSPRRSASMDCHRNPVPSRLPGEGQELSGVGLWLTLQPLP